MSSLRPGLLLDRDGVINVNHGYVSEWAKFDQIPGVERLIGAANRAGWGVAVVTNQSGIARGYFEEAQLHALHDALRAHLAGGATPPLAWIDAIYHCPYLKGATVPAFDRDSEDRKPRPGMLLKAIAELGLDPARTALIGDSPSDIAAADAAGVAGHLFEGGDLWDFAAARLPALAAHDPQGLVR
jgi:D-glycero-D-manno-heptose 1,7-bisphosphate phosphatase